MGVAGGPDIIENGLVLSLDASDRNSYVSGSTRWFDLSGNNNSGSLVNGPTFNTGSGGVIVFDGVNDYVSGSSNVALSNNFTLQISIKPDIISSGNLMLIGDYQFSYESNLGWYIGLDNRPSLSVGNTVFISIGSDSSYLYSAQNALITNGTNNYIVSFVCTGGLLSLYVNGIQTSGLAVNNKARSISYTGSIFNIATRSRTSYYKGSWYNYLLYNRALSAQEVLQNYNATKARFGL